MWNPFRQARDERHEERQAFLSALAGLTELLKTQQHTHLQVIETITQANIEVARGLSTQGEAFNTWLKSFQTSAVPEVRVTRDVDEWAAERDLLRARGFPIDKSQEEQLKFVDRQFLFDDLENLV